ncbi:MAG TPA: hypothetical protein VF877_11545 [Gaiellaceae bacterium]
MAANVDSKEPVWALRSAWVYRAEVGSSVIGLLYLPLVALVLAWRGETFRRFQVPGGAGVEAPAEEIETAANEFSRYESQNEKRFQNIENAIDKLNQRVDAIAKGEGTLRARDL